MTISLTTLLSVVLPILATTILFALMLSVAFLLAPRPKVDRVCRPQSGAGVLTGR